MIGKRWKPVAAQAICNLEEGSVSVHAVFRRQGEILLCRSYLVDEGTGHCAGRHQ